MNGKKEEIASKAGLILYDHLWEKHNLTDQFNRKVKKHSGKEYGLIMKNLCFRSLINANSMVALSEKDKQEFFLRKNVSLHRTSYGRNLKKINNQRTRNKILLKTTKKILGDKIDKKSLMIFDPSACEVFGDTYPETRSVWDSTQNKPVRGYGVNKFLVATKKKKSTFNYNLNDNSKLRIAKTFTTGRNEFGINRVSFDAGVQGLEFFEELDKLSFLFYTKADNGWNFNYGKDFKIKELRKHILYLLKRNGVLSRTVYHKNMKLRLVFVLNDKRVFLTNDFKSSDWDIVRYYLKRWDVEVSFREEKQNLGFAELPTTNLAGIKTHFLLVFLAYALSQCILSKTNLVKGIKLIKRKIVDVIAKVKVIGEKIVLEFKERFRFSQLFKIILD